MNCVFCNIANGTIKANVVYSDEHVVAFRDLSPQAPHHVLVIPRRHVATVNDFSNDDVALIGRLVLAAQQVARDLGVDENGYRLVMNCNRDAGQTVFHTHLHLLAGRGFDWPPG